jgi:hypothetical protein
LRAASEGLVDRFFILVLTCCVLCAAFFDLRCASAYPIRVSFQNAAGQPVSGVKIRGSHGINQLPILVSDARGEWSFDTNDVRSPQAVIAFSGIAAGVRLEPAELKVSDLLASGVRIKNVVATTSSTPSAIISWRVVASASSMLSGVSVGLLNPYRYSCESRVTDSDGYVVWSVPSMSGRCDDRSQNTAWYQVVPYESGATRCSSFTTNRSVGQRACPFGGDDEGGVSSGSCGSVSNSAITTSSKFRMVVTAAGSETGVPGVEIVGNSNLRALPARETDTKGAFQFTLSDVPGATTSSVFDFVPVKDGYEFMPRRRDSRECLLSSNNTFICEFSAIRTDAPQGALVMNVTQATQPLGGVSVVQPMGLGCLLPTVRYSDAYGVAVLPVRVRKTCSKVDGVSWNDPVSLYPAMKGKGFTSSSQFEYCPTSLQTTAAIAAYDDSSGIQNVEVSGQVIGLQGAGLSGAQILMNGEVRATTDALGRFSIYPVVQGTTVKLQAQFPTYAFDPEFDTYEYVSGDVNAQFVARAPDPLGGEIDPPADGCPVKSSYTISGAVLDLAGHPIVGATIYDNGEASPVATTDASGMYTFDVSYGSAHWVTVENGNALFEPAGRAFPDVVCDAPGADFQQVEYESVLLGGKVTDVTGAPLADAALQITVDGSAVPYSVTTGSDGRYLLSVRSGAHVSLSAFLPGYNFEPERRELQLEGARTDADFSSREAIPTPISPTTAPTTAPPSAPTTVPTVAPTAPGSAPQPAPVYPTTAPTLQPTTVPEQPPYQPPAPVPTSGPSDPLPTIAPTSGGGVPQPQPTDVPGGGPMPPSAPIAPPPSVPPPGVPPTQPGPFPPEAPTSAPGWPSPIPPDQSPLPEQPPYMPPTTPGYTPPPAAPVPPEQGSPSVAIQAECPDSASFTPPPYKWIVSHLGGGAFRGWVGVFDVNQPLADVWTKELEVQVGEVVRLPGTPDLAIPTESYRVRLFMVNEQGQVITLAVAAWDMSRCFQSTPTPVPTEDPGSGTPEPTPAPIEAPQPGITPTPGVPGGPGPVPPPGGEVPMPTPTATPQPQFSVSIQLFDFRGRAMTRQQFDALKSLGWVRIEGRGVNYTQDIQFAEFTQANGITTLAIPAGRYKVSVGGSVRVMSVVGERKGARSYLLAVGPNVRPPSTIKFAVKATG